MGFYTPTHFSVNSLCFCGFLYFCPFFCELTILLWVSLYSCPFLCELTMLLWVSILLSISQWTHHTSVGFYTPVHSSVNSPYFCGFLYWCPFLCELTILLWVSILLPIPQWTHQNVCHPKRDKMSAILKWTKCLPSQKGQNVCHPKRDKMSAIPKGTSYLPSQKGQVICHPKRDWVYMIWIGQTQS